MPASKVIIFDDTGNRISDIAGPYNEDSSVNLTCDSEGGKERNGINKKIKASIKNHTCTHTHAHTHMHTHAHTHMHTHTCTHMHTHIKTSQKHDKSI